MIELLVNKNKSYGGGVIERLYYDVKSLSKLMPGKVSNLKHWKLSNPGGGYFTINSYGGVRRKDFCYDPIPEIWSDIDTQSQNICQILIPNRRNNKNNLTSKG